jgi:hypothetical protein
MFLCYFGADVALNLKEITTKRTAERSSPKPAPRAIFTA